LEDWTEEKNDYIAALENLFTEHILEKEKEYNTFNYVVRAMQRWFISLPKYAKEMKSEYTGGGKTEKLSPEKVRFINSLKVAEINAREYLFEKVFDILGYGNNVVVGAVDNIEKIKIILDEAKVNLIAALAADVRKLFLDGQPNNASLASVIKDWYDGLSDNAKKHLYNNGEDQVLELLRTIPNDEAHFIQRIAKVVVGLRIDDWDDSTVMDFLRELEDSKRGIEERSRKEKTEEQTNNDVYRISFIDKDGKEVQKTFDKTKRSEKAELLENDIVSALKDFGQAISENEKRQVLIDIIERMCR
jgi:rubrerythrin